MNSYNYSYNVLINRLEAFAAGHLLIKRFTHGQIDLADMDQDEQYPFMHVVPNNIKPVDGGMQFDFQIIFADIPRDKEVKAEYQREVISDCVRLAQDLISEVKNGLVLFGFDVQLVTPPVIEPFMEEYKNTLTGVTFSLQLEVPWDWSACDIPAVWAVGGSSSGGSGSPIGIVLRTNGVDNAVQNILDLVAGTNITITDNGDGSVSFDASGGGGGGGGPYVSTEFNVNHATAIGNQYVVGDRVWYNGSVYACIANNDAINPTNPTYWTLQAVGYRLRQSPVDWNATSGDYQILNKPTIPSPQGLQDVITTDPVLTQDNTIDCNTYGLTIDGTQNLTVNSTSKVDINVNSDAELGIDSASVTMQKVTGATQTQVIVDTTKAAVSASASGAETSLTLSPTSAKLVTPSVDAGTATVGQVLGLSNASTGEVEFITVAGGGGTVTSVGLTMPAAFSVAGSPVTTSGTLAVTGAGSSSQYVDGTGALQTFPTLPPTVGDMLKSVYDLQDVGVVESAHKELVSVINKTGSTVTKGQIVYLKTSSASGTHPEIVLATATTEVGSSKTIGAIWQDIANDAVGWVVTSGEVSNLDTSAYSIGDRLWLGTTAGSVTTTPPSEPNHTVFIGTVTRSQNVNGRVLYAIQNGYELNELHGVEITSEADNNILMYDGATSLWKNNTLAYLQSLLGVATATVTTNQVTVGTTFENVTGLSFAVTSGKTYKWRATISFGATTGTYLFSSNGPTTSINNARFTMTTGGTTNGVSNQVAFDTGTNVTGSSNGLTTADGIVRATANGTFVIRFRSSVAGALTVRAGSVLEYTEVL